MQQTFASSISVQQNLSNKRHYINT